MMMGAGLFTQLGDCFVAEHADRDYWIPAV